MMIVKMGFTITLLVAYNFFYGQVRKECYGKFKSVNGFPVTDNNCGQPWSWTVNRVTVKEEEISISIHYPAFDTVVATHTISKETRTIISRFDSGHKYLLISQSCDNAMDISDEAASEWMKPPYDSVKNLPPNEQDDGWIYADSIYRRHEMPSVIFKLLNGTEKDSVGGTFGDIHIGYTTGILLSNLADTISDPFRTESSGNCYESIIARFSRSGQMSDDPYRQGIYFGRWSEPSFFLKNELFHTYFRFFNREKIILTYDLKNKKVKIEIAR